MQQDQQATVPSSSSRLTRRSGSIFRRPPFLLPIEEEHDRDSDEYGSPDISKQLTAKMLGVAKTHTTSEDLPLIPGKGIPSKGMSRKPNSDTPREGLHYIPNSLMPQQINYDELDDRLGDELDFSRMSTVHLMQLSGMMQAIPKPKSIVNA